MIIESLKTKKYKMPKKIPASVEHRYVKLLNKGYAKYLDAIHISGGFCMLNQFKKLVGAFESDKRLSAGTISVYASSIVQELERLNFIGTEYINRHKYIYLRHSSFALCENDYDTYKRLNLKNLNINKFTISIMKMEFLVSRNNQSAVYSFDKHLINISEEILESIVSSGNKYQYHIETIEKIIKLRRYKDIKELLDKSNERTIKLGVFRLIWEELAKEFWKLSVQGLSIEKEPFYFKINILDDGEVTLHYAPTIIVFDINKNLDYYDMQANKYFNLFFNLTGNSTNYLKEEFNKSNAFGYNHFNRIGYTLKIIGTKGNAIEKKAEIFNKAYYGKDNKHLPLISPCTFVTVDIDTYFKTTKHHSNMNSNFKSSNEILTKIISEKKGEI